ncbi:MAG: hypothetical protein R2838_01420 [Caldilineaceae bacterium]
MTSVHPSGQSAPIPTMRAWQRIAFLAALAVLTALLVDVGIALAQSPDLMRKNQRRRRRHRPRRSVHLDHHGGEQGTAPRWFGPAQCSFPARCPAARSTAPWSSTPRG